jgi:two-component system CheB/CheR fusion protein
MRAKLTSTFHVASVSRIVTRPSIEPGVRLRPAFPIAAIGASAGGLSAIEELISRLTTSEMAFVILHVGPDQERRVAAILAHAAPMQIAPIADGTRIEPNVIYVALTDDAVTLEGTVFRVAPGVRANGESRIDLFFRSLAENAPSRAIGVVLSGTDGNGAAGLAAIKASGGITFVEDPSSAPEPTMPQSAIDAGAADFVLRPAEIASELNELASHPFVAQRSAPRLFTEDFLAQIFDLLRRTHGIDFGAYKRRTVERRIERRMVLQKLERAEDYLRFLKTSTAELRALYSDLLITVTSFFRDREPFHFLSSTVFPRLVEDRNSERPIRVWIPGCASGEEAYSIAIALLEFLGDRASFQAIQIFATDIDERALQIARAGIYPQLIEQSVSRERLQKFFVRHEKGYQVAQHVRDLVVFARHNVSRDPPFSRLDLISCRNMLIYMQAPLQRRVLRTFHYALTADAFLMLGTSETIGDGADLFSLLDRRMKIYQKKNTHSPAVFDFAMSSRSAANELAPSHGRASLPQTLVKRPVHATQSIRRPMASVQQLADRKVIEKYGPPAVLLNESLEVIQFRGQTGPFLSPAPGTATFNIFKLARPELVMELRSTIREALDQEVAVSSAPIHCSEPLSADVTIDVMPVHDGMTERRCVLVSFRVEDDDRVHECYSQPRETANSALFDLERELLLTREYLQTTVHDLEASNEELQSANEELQNANEELQSANEELETSKEELQSSNEELEMVNEELRTRMQQLTVANDDVNNILAFATTTFVIVEHDLRIRRFSKAAEKLLSLIPSDVGRPIGYLSTMVKSPQLERLVAESIESGSRREQRVRCTDGLWYTMHVCPYRTTDGAIGGATLELARASVASRNRSAMVEIHELVAKILGVFPNVLLLLDDQLRVVWIRKHVFDLYGIGDDVLGLPLEDLWPAWAEESELWARLELAACTGSGFESYAVSSPFEPDREQPVKLSARTIAGEGAREALVLLVMEEVVEGA